MNNVELKMFIIVSIMLLSSYEATVVVGIGENNIVTIGNFKMNNL